MLLRRHEIYANSKKPSDISIAFFISPHGFGHAVRESTVMDAL